jgi:hypothetical protein
MTKVILIGDSSHAKLRMTSGRAHAQARAAKLTVKEIIMAFRKRTSSALDKAEVRSAAIKGIAVQLNFGGGLSLPAYEAKVAGVRDKLTTYNTLLSQVDRVSDELDLLEKELIDLNERMLTGVATQFGKDSPEYEAAGGTRKSERKKPQRKPLPPTSGA